MLNYQQRGATLQAIVSRILSINKKVRVIAVSATIPNIQEVAEWLKVPPNFICVYGPQYRPVKLNKVVHGFNNAGNPFLFQKMLNYRLLQIIRQKSQGRGTLIFCPTQKGTQSACDQIILQMKQRQFVENDKQLLSLIQASKNISNNSLKIMLPQGIAFHNASLSPQDRSIIEGLFLQMKLKVLCTTSTLSMGINLPARLVIVKSTLCYRGSGKGYQQYSRIQMDQMMGRAGRPPFDTQGTVVILTQKHNFNKYNSNLQLQNLQSQLFENMLQHINAQISMGSIQCIQNLYEYFFNSFCFIRMKKSPQIYNINENVVDYVKKSCYNALQSLQQLFIIYFSKESGKITPKPLSHSISKNSVQIKSIQKIFRNKQKIISQYQYLWQICSCEQIGKYTSKIQQRKTLKQINDKNKYNIKQAISNPQRKCFVLSQAILSNISIQFWQLKRQANQIIVLLKRLNYCIKVLGLQIKNYWLVYWSSIYQKYLKQQFWQYNEQKIMMQLSNLQDKGKFLHLRGIKKMQSLKNNLQGLKSWIPNIQDIKDQIDNYSQKIQLLIKKQQKTNKILLVCSFKNDFKYKMNGLWIILGTKQGSVYDSIHLNENKRQYVFVLNKNMKDLKIGIIKDTIIGFDQFYILKDNFQISIFNWKQLDHQLPNIKKLKDIKNNIQKQQTIYIKKSKSQDQLNKLYNDQVQQTLPNKNIRNSNIKNIKSCSREQTLNKYKKKIQPNNIITISNNHKRSQPIFMSQQPNDKKITIYNGRDQFKYKPLTSYKWKPGFQQIKSSSSQSEQVKRKNLKLINQQSKQKQTSLNNNYKIKSLKYSSPFGLDKKQQKKQQSINYSYLSKQKNQNQNISKTQKQSEGYQKVFNFFYNLF